MVERDDLLLETPSAVPSQGWRPATIFGTRFWKVTASSPSPAEPRSPTGEKDSTVTRLKSPPPYSLSSLFDGWLGEAQHAQLEASERPLSSGTVVSEPIPLPEDKTTILILSDAPAQESAAAADLDEAFESLMDELGIRGVHRDAMLQLSSSRKSYLVEQQKLAFSPTTDASAGPLMPTHTGSSVVSTAASAASRSSSFASAGLPASRFSTASGDVSSAHPTTELASSRQSSQTQSSNTSTITTLSSSWMPWLSGGLSLSAKSGQLKDFPSYYVHQLRSSKISQNALLKQLISLRVSLSTAKLSWIAEFLGEAEGLDALESLMSKTAKSLMDRCAGNKHLDKGTDVYCNLPA
jgi:diaphanous 1